MIENKDGILQCRILEMKSEGPQILACQKASYHYEAEGFMETPNAKQLVVLDFECIDADGFYQLPLP